MHLDIQGEDLSRFDVLGPSSRLSVGAVKAGAGHLGDGAVGGDIGKTHEPVSPRGVGGHPENGPGQPQDLGVLGQGIAVVGQAEGIGTALVVGHIPPPHDGAAGLHAGAGYAAQLVRGFLGLHVGQGVIGLRMHHPLLDTLHGPAVFPAPESRRSFQVWAGGVPLAYVDREARLIHDPGVDALQPLVEPAHRLVAPLHARLGVGIVWKGVGPRPDHRLDRRFQVLKHPRQAVPIAVIPAADVEGGYLDLLVAVPQRGAVPEGAVSLLVLVGHHPGLGVKAVAEVRLVDDVVRGAGPGVVQILAHLPRVHVHDAVHEVHVVLVEVLGGVHGDDGLEGRRVATRHLNGVEAAPRDAEHANISVAPGLFRQPVDDHLAILVFPVGVLVGNQPALAVAGAAHVHRCQDIAAFDEVRVEGEIAGPRLGFAIGQVLEDDRKGLPLDIPRRHVEIRREPHPVGQGDPDLLHLHLIRGG